MAQWAGGYSGDTHATRVAEVEAALRQAAAALKSEAADGPTPKAVAKARKLAERLLSARLRMLKARISALKDASVQETVPPAGAQLASPRQRLATVEAQGLPGILAEFGVDVRELDRTT
jgi:hypothetical protein